jgi:uncharacterized protein YcbK (DUF882 family)
MGDLSQHFDRREFACQCMGCGQDQVDYELVMVLERLRSHIRQPIKITSGNRCHEHNMRVGGSKISQHMWSKAADIKVDGWPPKDVYELLDSWYPDKFGLVLYSGWVHVDVRKNKYRNDKR